MQESLRNGFVAAFAVSGGVVFIAMHAHNRLLSDFIKKMESHIKDSTGGALEDVPKKKRDMVKKKKKVRFADDVVEESVVERAYDENHRRRPAAAASDGEILETMPQNWQVLYKGILRSRNIRG